MVLHVKWCKCWADSMKTDIPTKVNITLKLDKELIRQARMMAVETGTSISALLAAKLEEVVRKRKDYEQAKRSALAILNEGWDLGGRPLTRDEMHER
jgi:hypothetical protein